MESADLRSSLVAITLASASFCGAAAFAFHRSHRRKDDHMNRRTTLLSKDNLREPKFHEVLQRMGKTVLRPGGSEATKNVQEMANVRAGDTVLELSAGLGRSGIELAERYGARVTLTDVDASRLERAADLAEGLGLSDSITTRTMDMFDVDTSLGPDAKFDAAQTEASLTFYPRSRKAAFFRDVARHADKFILHEMCFRTENEALQEAAKRDMSKVLNIGFIPETSETWQRLLSDAGFTAISYVSTGDLAVLDPRSLVKDEGLLGFANIVFNIATNPYLRSRMLAVRKKMAMHSDTIGYIAIVASKK